MNQWSYTLETASGSVLSYLNSLGGMTLTMPLNAPATLTADIAHNTSDMQALDTQLASGAVILRAARNGVTRFVGTLSDMQVSFADDAKASLTFTDFAGAYASVSNYSISGGRIKPYQKQSPATWTGTIDQLLSYGSPIVPLTRSGAPTGRIPTPEIIQKANKQKTKVHVWKPSSTTVLETLQELSGFAPGIEWYVSPDALFVVQNVLGSDKSKSVLFQYGQGTLSNVLAVNAQYQPPQNDLFWTDAKSTIHRSRSGYNTSSIDSFGDYSVTYNQMTKSSQTDDYKVASRLRSKWRIVWDLVAEPTLAPQPWTDYFLGDTISVRVKRDAFDQSLKQRVNQITVTTDEGGNENAHQLTFEVI
jgi:hypothetical protein